MPEVILTLNASQHNKELAVSMEMTEAKAKETAAAIEKAAASASTAGTNAAQKIAKEGEKSGKSLKEAFAKWRESFTAGGAADQLAGAFTGVELIKKGIEICVTLAKDLWNRLTLSAEEMVSIASAQVEMAEKESSKYTDLINQTSEYLSRMKELTSQENLSASSTKELANIVAYLNQNYSGLNLTIDKLTGSMEEMEKIQNRIAAEQAKRKKDNLRREYNSLRSLAVGQAKIAVNAGTDITRNLLYSISPGLRNATVGDIEKMFAGRKENGESYDPKEMIKLFQQLLAEAKTEAEIKAYKDLLDTWQKIDTVRNQYAEVKNGTTTKQESEQNRRYHAVRTDLDRRDQAVSDAHDQLAESDFLATASTEAQKKYFQGKAAGVDKQIDDVRKKREAASRAVTEAIAQGASEARILDLRKKLTELSEEEIKLLRQRADLSAKIQAIDTAAAAEAQKKVDAEKAAKAAAEAAAEAKAKQLRSARQGILGKAQSLMDKTLSPKESAYASTLRDFESKKGESATDQEKDLIRKLADLTVSIGEKTDLKFSEIQTNSLTARGGFQTGAVLGDKDALQRQIEKNTQREAKQSEEIKNLVKKITDLLEV